MFYEDFSGFETGMFSADVGPHTEYHYLAEAAPKHGWSVACFASREEGRAWWIEERDGNRVMRQTMDADRLHTHPMLCAGDPLWQDYTLSVRMMPEPGGKRCGLVLRYHNNRCYTFFGFDGDRVILTAVRHESGFHVPFEKLLAEFAYTRENGREYLLTVEVAGDRYSATIDGVCTLTGVDGTYRSGKIGLLADGPAAYYEVRVDAPPETAYRLTKLADKQSRDLADRRENNPTPVLWKRFSTEGFGAARNVRFGDLTGNGVPDLVVGQITHHGPLDRYSEVGCITAMTFDGEILWQSGQPDPDAYHLTNDVGLQIHDIDGDGRNEVVYCRDFEIVIADGATGAVKHRASTPLSRPPMNRYERILGDCLHFCDLRGIGRAGDILIKDRYWNVWAYDDRLNPLWDVTCRTGHYPFAADIDGDGHDEVAVGYALYNHDGSLIWNIENSIDDHADGIAIVDFSGDGTGEPRIMYAGSDAGMLYVSLSGDIIRHHRVGHVQNPAVAKFRADLPGLQTVSVNFWGNQGILHFYDADGNIYHDSEPLNMGSMCLPVNWKGDGEEFFVLNPNPVHGGMFDGWGRPVVMFPDDGHPDMCNAVLDITGDCRDEVVVWDQHEVWVYTQDDYPRVGRLYCPKRSSLANYSNYQATVSLPGWESTDAT